MFRDRQDAASRLARPCKRREFVDPLVLAIPKGGVILGAVIAKENGAELDVALARKLQAPHQPELAIGAISEEGHVWLNPAADDLLVSEDDYLGKEKQRRLNDLKLRKQKYRAVRPPATIRGRSVLLVDDGIATGATMIAACQIVKSQEPAELIVCVPVGTPESVIAVREWCDEVVCLHQQALFGAIGQFYDSFPDIDDEQVLALLKANYARERSTAL